MQKLERRGGVNIHRVLVLVFQKKSQNCLKGTLQHFTILIFFFVALHSGDNDNCGVSTH